MNRHHVTLLTAMLLGTTAAFSLLGCGGCAGARHGTDEKSQHAVSAETTETAPPPPAMPAEMHGIALRPAETEPTPEALNTFAFLVFAQAMQQEDEALLTASAPLLAKAAMPAHIWLEGGVWLMGRKSPHTLEFMEQATAAFPHDISVLLLYAEALTDRGMAERGVALMRDFLKNHPDSLEARLELALLLVKNSQYGEAESLLNGIEGKKRTPLVNYYHARALIGMDRPKDAVPYLQRAVNDLPDFTEAVTELAFLYEKAGNLRGALALYERLIKLHGTKPEILLRLTDLALRLRQPERALAYIRRGPERPQFLLSAVMLLVEAHHYLQAEGLLKQMVNRPDPPADAYIMLADVAYEQRRDLNQAFSWLDKIPADSPGAPQALQLRCHLLSREGRETEGLALVRQARATSGDTPGLAEAEIRLLARMQQKSQALEIARKAVEHWPDNGEMLFLLGSLQDETGDKHSAFQTMEHLIDLHPDNYQALNYVGYTLAEEDRELERAVELLRKADRLAPNQSYIVDSLAWAYFKMGRLEEALKEIRRAVELDEQADSSIWEHYGDIAARLSLKDEARRAYEKALELKPDNAEALRKRLAEL